ncbi:glycosyltransferase family 2 protein [Paenibacillus sp. H1-7]|uniref:glycosyltransferase family 2 protein n=1 Tax=Paenibacillus sp. H1-7 TaxID=2282849 RepID=UPI001EF93051|nr:glycosyltransferase family 2 protein [Paenibacillus sp. H1-7]
MNISLCMIVRDEEEHLARCLSSVAGTVKEIIVVDTGSTDRTVSIARSFGARVVSVPWRHDFAEARNRSLELATEPWILVLDADEQWVAPPDDKLARLLKQDGVLGYYVRMLSYVGPHGDEHVTDAVCRLFRNDPRIRYTGRIHEDVASRILSLAPEGLVFSDLEIVHYGYLDRVIQQKNKHERNLTLIREALKLNKDDLQLLYALGTEYYQQAQYGRTLTVFESLLPRVPVYGGYTSDLLLKMAYAYRATGFRDEALRMTEEALRLYPDFTDLYEVQALVLTDAKRYREALQALDKAMATGDVSEKYSSSSGAGTYRSCYLSGIVYERLYCWEDALACYELALADQPGYVPAWQRLAPICAATERMDRLSAALRAHGRRLPPHAQAALLEAAVDLQRPEWLLQHRDALQAALALQPLAEGLALAQSGRLDAAEGALRPWAVHPQHGAAAALSLWALAVKRADAQQDASEAELPAAAFEPARQALLRLVAADGSFAPLEWLTPGAAPVGGDDGDPLPLPDALRAQAAQALLRVGAWEAWLRLSADATPEFAAMPHTVRCGMLQAPAAVQERLLDLLLAAEPPAEELDRPGLLLAGVLALERGRSQDALAWFWAAREQAGAEPAAVPAAVGVLHALAQLASGVANGRVPIALASEIRAVILD